MIKYTKDYVFKLADKYDSIISFENKESYASKVADKNGWKSEIYNHFEKKTWERNKPIRIFAAFSQTEAFRKLYNEFSKNYVDEEFTPSIFGNMTKI